MGIKAGFSKDPEIRARQLEWYRNQEKNKEFLEKITAELNFLKSTISQVSQQRLLTEKEKKDILSLIQATLGYIKKLK